MNEIQTEKPTVIEIALRRALDDMGEKYNSMADWASSAGIENSTLRSAMKGNPTHLTLERLAAAAGLTVGDLLDYGENDWRARIALRKTFSSWSEQDIMALRNLLERRSAGASAASEK